MGERRDSARAQSREQRLPHPTAPTHARPLTPAAQAAPPPPASGKGSDQPSSFQRPPPPAAPWGWSSPQTPGLWGVCVRGGGVGGTGLTAAAVAPPHPPTHTLCAPTRAALAAEVHGPVAALAQLVQHLVLRGKAARVAQRWRAAASRAPAPAAAAAAVAAAALARLAAVKQPHRRALLRSRSPPGACSARQGQWRSGAGLQCSCSARAHPGRAPSAPAARQQWWVYALCVLARARRGVCIA